LQGANLEGANLEGANLRGANLVNISYDEQTCWPTGFNLPASVIYTQSRQSSATQSAPSEQPCPAVTQKLPVEDAAEGE
jgi:uncharacterized protein YjbI with pentapeptide repeats